MEDTTLDPAYVIASGSYRPVFAVFNNIVQLAPDGSIKPDLAQSWEYTPDGKTITFHLQTNVKFQDGTPFNAQAIKWNFDRILDPNNISPRRGSINGIVTSVEVVDQDTLRMRLNQPYRPLLADLTDRTGWISSPDAVRKLGRDYGRRPVGTGPFILKNWLPDEYLQMDKNPNYWEKGKPYLDAIRILVLGDPSTTLAMLRTGEADVVETLNPQDIRIVQASSNMKLSPPIAGRTEIMNFNVSMAPFNNKALRQAVGFGIDRETAVRVAFGGVATPAFTLISSGWAYNPDIKPIYYDPQKSKQKLAEAGYPNGVTLNLGCRTSQQELTECQTYQAMLKDVGITINIVPIPSQEYTSPTGFITRTGFGTLRWSPRADPAILLHSQGNSRDTTYAYYRAGWNNDRVNQLLDEAATIYDIAKAKVMYDEAQNLIAEDGPYVYIAWRREWIALGSKVQNWQWRPDAFHRLRELWIDK